MNSKLIFLSICLSLGSFIAVPAQQSGGSVSRATIVRAETYYRTELYLGRSIPGGGIIGDDAWEKFLSDIVTQLFPNGFTVLSGRGQYREASGVIAKEPSNVLVFLYRKAERKRASASIEKIREEYKKQFSQESVLRVDITKSVSVSF